MKRRPHPKVATAEHGTRFPGALLAALDGALPRIPATIAIERYRDAAGELRLPLARGRISWVRRADERGVLALQGRRLPLGRIAADQYVVATLSSGRGDIVVRVGERVVKRFDFANRERVVRPLRRRG